MSIVRKKNLFMISGIICVILLAIAAFSDLAISNTVINYNSWFGTIFQTFGEFPVYFIFVVSGEIAMNYAFKKGDELLFAIPLFLAGLGLSAWQTKQYVNEVSSYLASIVSNMDKGNAIGLANSDENVKGLSVGLSILIWLAVYFIFTAIMQVWLAKKDALEIKRYLMIAIFASLTVWFALEVNLALKDFWGRVRPYELSASQSEFTSWLHPNGINGHKSFPSGHTMAGTLCIVFAWFVSKANRTKVWIFGIVYGALMGISRVIIGAHFFSDVVFSFFLTALIIFIMNELLQRLAPENS